MHLFVLFFVLLVLSLIRCLVRLLAHLLVCSLVRSPASWLPRFLSVSRQTRRQYTFFHLFLVYVR